MLVLINFTYFNNVSVIAETVTGPNDALTLEFYAENLDSLDMIGSSDPYLILYEVRLCNILFYNQSKCV
jgi:hypothetical protein